MSGGMSLIFGLVLDTHPKSKTLSLSPSSDPEIKSQMTNFSYDEPVQFLVSYPVK